MTSALATIPPDPPKLHRLSTQTFGVATFQNLVRNTPRGGNTLITVAVVPRQIHQTAALSMFGFDPGCFFGAPLELPDARNARSRLCVTFVGLIMNSKSQLSDCDSVKTGVSE